jgi:hypothetical protein
MANNSEEFFFKIWKVSGILSHMVRFGSRLAVAFSTRLFCLLAPNFGFIYQFGSTRLATAHVRTDYLSYIP